MLIAAHRVEAAVGRELHLVHEVVVHQVCALRVEQRRMHINPYRRMLLAEVVRQFGVRHQMEPEELHGQSSLLLPASMASKLPGPSTHWIRPSGHRSTSSRR